MFHGKFMGLKEGWRRRKAFHIQVYGTVTKLEKGKKRSQKRHFLVLIATPANKLKRTISGGFLTMDIIEKALQLAAQAHEGQYRKRSNIPYITHPVAVGMILLKAGYEEDIVAAGILHDTVEDTELTLSRLQKEFGPRIASIVEGCSEPDKSLPWEKRKEHSIEFFKKAPEEIRAVASADKLHNVRSILLDYEREGDRVWGKFIRGKDQQEWYYRSIIDSLGYLSYFTILEELQREINRLFSLE